MCLCVPVALRFPASEEPTIDILIAVYDTHKPVVWMPRQVPLCDQTSQLELGGFKLEVLVNKQLSLMCHPAKLPGFLASF